MIKGAPATAETGPRTQPRPATGRAVLLVANTAAPYSRALRVGRSLAQAGWDVEIAAVAGSGLSREERHGAVLVRRYAPGGPFRRWIGQPPPPSPPTKLLQVLALNLDKALKVAFWPIHVRAWWQTLRRELPPADVSIIAVPADSLNRRLSTPNKSCESLAGTPVVLGVTSR